MSQGVRADKPPVDRGMLVIVALVGINVGWLLMTPLVPSVAMATMRRFHLDYESFCLWGIQQTIPAMYNFANRYQVQTHELIDIAGDRASGIGEGYESEFRYANHFPVRILTFADTRIKHLRSGQDCWLTIETSYRGQSIRSRFHAQAHARATDQIKLQQQEQPEIGYTLVRLSAESER